MTLAKSKAIKVTATKTRITTRLKSATKLLVTAGERKVGQKEVQRPTQDWRRRLTGVEQVHKAISQMDRATQGNASQTEEVSSTASALHSNAEQLQKQIGRFYLGF